MHNHAHSHAHAHPSTSRRTLTTAVALTLGFAGVELVVGLWSGSLTLLGDAAHMATDSLALGLAALAAWVGSRPPTPRHSYGLGRVEVVAALFNGLFMLAVVAGIAVEAVERLHTPTPVMGGAVFAVASIGLLINLGVAYVLSRGEATLNVRAALLHVIGDLLGSVAAVAAGAIIYLTGWHAIDPILALAVCVLLLFSSLHLLRESLHVVLEGVPSNVDLPRVGRSMAELERVRSVHDLHIWTLPSGEIAISAHVVITDMRHWERVLGEMRTLLEENFGITHVTLQPEVHEYVLHPM